MDKGPTALRDGRPVVEDGLAFARYLDEAAEGFFRFMLGSRAVQVVADAYVQPDNDYSFQNVIFAEQDAAVVGMAAGFPAEQRRRFPDWPLRAAGLAALRMGAVRVLCAPLMRILKTIADGDFYLLAIATDKACRGSGVGSALMDAFEDRARAGESTRLCLEVSAKNEGARRFYEHRGMTVESQWPKRLPVPGLRFYRMTKAL